jgi:methylmalonyl-CoA/ethylmalonyl-CoA epimerase
MEKNKRVKSQFSKNFVHVGAVVRDMDESVKRLESLGIGPFEPLSAYQPPVVGKQTFRDKPMESKEKISVAKVGNIEIHLFQPVEGDSPWKDFLDKKGEGLHHIAFVSDDPIKDGTELSKLGADMIHQGKMKGGGAGVYLDLGVGGIILELIKT